LKLHPEPEIKFESEFERKYYEEAMNPKPAPPPAEEEILAW